MFTIESVCVTTIVVRIVRIVKTITPFAVKVGAVVTSIVIAVAVVTVGVIGMCVAIVTVVAVVVITVEFSVAFVTFVTFGADVKSVVNPVCYPVVMLASTNEVIITAITFKIFYNIIIIISISISRVTIVSSKKFQSFQSLPPSFSVSLSQSLSSLLLSLLSLCIIPLTRFYCLWTSTCLVKSNPSVNKNEQPINLSPALPSGF